MFPSPVLHDVLDQFVTIISETMVPEVIEYHHLPPMHRFNDSILDCLITVPESGKTGSRKSHFPFQLPTNEHLYDMFRHVILRITECKVATRCVMQITSDIDFSGGPIMFS
jgi:hypothetical protein